MRKMQKERGDIERGNKNEGERQWRWRFRDVERGGETEGGSSMSLSERCDETATKMEERGGGGIVTEREGDREKGQRGKCKKRGEIEKEGERGRFREKRVIERRMWQRGRKSMSLSEKCDEIATKKNRSLFCSKSEQPKLTKKSCRSIKMR